MALTRQEQQELYIGKLEQTVDYLEERMAEIELARDDVGWVRLGGESTVEFTRNYLNAIVSRSRLFFIQNPLINRAVTLQADYVFAQGVNIQATDRRVNKVIQDFMDDPQNKKEFTSHKARLEKEQTLILDGNLFLVLFTDREETGQVQIRSILVEEITDIITNPDDSNEVWFYKREWVALDGKGVQQRVAYYPDIEYHPKVARLPKTRDKAPIYWDAPVIQIKTGGLAKSRYGVPEVYAALDWAKAHSRMLSDWATIIKAYATFAFKLTTSGDKRSIAAARTKLGTTIGTSTSESNPPSVTASIFTRNKDGIDIEPVKTSGATTSAKDARELRIMVAAAVGLPDPMLSGEVDVGNLATAKTLDRPTELKFRSRQQLWTDVTITILNYVIKSSVLAPKGELNGLVKPSVNNRGELIINQNEQGGVGLHVEVVFPPILEHSILDRIDAVTEAVTLNGKHFALNSPELEKLTMRLMLQALGLNDVDELVKGIFDALQKEEPSTDDGKDTGSGSSTGDDSTTDSGDTVPDTSIRNNQRPRQSTNA